MSDTNDPVRFTHEVVPGATLAFLRYPISVLPAEGTHAVVTGDRWQTAGVFKDGQWRRQNGQPFRRPVRCWTILDPNNDAAA